MLFFFSCARPSWCVTASSSSRRHPIKNRASSRPQRTHPAVREHLAANGVTEKTRDLYLPREMRLRYRPSAAAGALSGGSGVLGGAMMFDLAFHVAGSEASGAGAFTTSYLIIVNYTGALLAVRPSGIINVSAPHHFNGLKVCACVCVCVCVLAFGVWCLVIWCGVCRAVVATTGRSHVRGSRL